MWYYLSRLTNYLFKSVGISKSVDIDVSDSGQLPIVLIRFFNRKNRIFFQLGGEKKVYLNVLECSCRYVHFYTKKNKIDIIDIVVYCFFAISLKYGFFFFLCRVSGWWKITFAKFTLNLRRIFEYQPGCTRPVQV